MKYHYRNLTDKIHAQVEHDCGFSPEDGCALYMKIYALVGECEDRVFTEENAIKGPVC
jgi:hypothetical protein